MVMAQPSLVTCRARPIASESCGTSSVRVNEGRLRRDLSYPLGAGDFDRPCPMVARRREISLPKVTCGRRSNRVRTSPDDAMLHGSGGVGGGCRPDGFLNGPDQCTTRARTERQSRYPVGVRCRLSGRNSSGRGCPLASSMGVKTST